MKNFIEDILFFIIPAEDKLKHVYQWLLLFFGLLFLADVIMYLCPEAVIPDKWSYWFTVGVAFYKEVIHDWLFKKGTPELKDFFFGVLFPTLYMIQTKP